mmetsp:Transcript_52773/g.140838  ORF Transcript_52773/g.140838 Transcript_52773/m.140838 type:complete len:248 (+) Transcript_52773:742-1485(+)
MLASLNLCCVAACVKSMLNTYRKTPRRTHVHTRDLKLFMMQWIRSLKELKKRAKRKKRMTRTVLTMRSRRRCVMLCWEKLSSPVDCNKISTVATVTIRRSSTFQARCSGSKKKSDRVQMNRSKSSITKSIDTMVPSVSKTSTRSSLSMASNWVSTPTQTVSKAITPAKKNSNQAFDTKASNRSCGVGTSSVHLVLSSPARNAADLCRCSKSSNVSGSAPFSQASSWGRVNANDAFVLRTRFLRVCGT